jgi:LEA14-like dessication related protein
MKKQNNMIYIIGAAAVAGLGYFWLRNKKEAAANLQILPKNVKVDWQKSKESAYTRLFYSLKLDLINNETASVNVKTINLNVVGNNKLLGNILNTSGFRVPPNSTKEIIISGAINSGSIINLIIDLIKDGFNIAVNVKGYVQTDLGRVQVDSSKQVSV